MVPELRPAVGMIFHPCRLQIWHFPLAEYTSSRFYEAAAPIPEMTDRGNSSKLEREGLTKARNAASHVPGSAFLVIRFIHCEILAAKPSQHLQSYSFPQWYSP